MSSGRHCNSWRLQSGRLMPIIVGYEQEEEKHSNCGRFTDRTQPVAFRPHNTLISVSLKLSLPRICRLDSVPNQPKECIEADVDGYCLITAYQLSSRRKMDHR